MNKRVTPQQLDMVQELSPEEVSRQLDAKPITDSDPLDAVYQEQNVFLAHAGHAPEDYDDFDWSEDPSVVLREQRATAIYRNPYEGIVIRQKKSWPDEESDPFMVITEESAVTFMEALAKVQRE